MCSKDNGIPMLKKSDNDHTFYILNYTNRRNKFQ